MDIFHKIKWLHQIGVKIHLHCFTKERPPQDELDDYCEEVFYYQRKHFLQAIPVKLPFMVASRNHPALLKNLQQDNYPILLEGIQCSWLLSTDALKDRQIFLRLHNAEFLYYEKLASHEQNFFRKLYYKNESRLLKKYERLVSERVPILSLSTSDISLYRKFFGAVRIQFLPAFTAWEQVTAVAGRGKYCLYHGNLGINENEKAVEWLLQNVFAHTDIPFVVAGKRPSEQLQKLIETYPNCSLVESPTDTDLQELIHKAQLNVLPSFNNTGVKLKLLNALYNGRHCLVNEPAIEGAAIPKLCHVANSPAEFLRKTLSLFEQDFCEASIAERTAVLSEFYNNEENAKSLLALLKPTHPS